ncbi:hypothetical protein NA57DRAFT_75046 [Rhizodiscina lignyota]|uniref:Integral membrane protein n=1 Tax=Rhizodiscina lignyota TaxID=1504668 RepID=A0A9P4IH51_9PEZI|nr:hypothetical protein NA57DRAFT_75046 [Rhizodiscina lignyota]
MIRLGLPSSVRVLVISCTLFFLFITYGRNHFYRDPGSAFFDQDRAFERYYSLVRELEASDWRNEVFHQLKGHTNQTTHGNHDVLHSKGPDPQLCAVFVTAYREGGPQYVDTAISSALAGLTPAERKDIDVRLYVANTDPSVHPAWNSWLRDVVDDTFTTKDNVYASKMQHMKVLEKEKKFHEKAGLDYSVALQRCVADSAAPYIAIFEGDVIIADGWFARTLLGLKDIREQYEMGTKQWLYMRLFNEERSTGWATKDPLGNNVLWISLGVDVFLCAIAFLLKRHSRLLGPLFSPLSMLIICLITVPGLVILFFQAGKASMLPPSTGVHREDGFGCCNQGMIYPREVAADLASYLEEMAANMPHDNAIMEYHRKKQLALFALYPMQVQHVGFRSIITPNRRDDMEVWSMAFESLSPTNLAHDHERMVKEIYGDKAWELT